MGFWGSSLYANDYTCDVRDTYVQFLQSHLTNDEAFLKTVEEFNERMGSGEEALFWYALADTQWDFGRLTPEVREKAFVYLERNSGLEYWEKNTKEYQDWGKTIAKLKGKLNKTQPREKRVECPADWQYNPGNIGDVFAYCFHSKEAEKLGYHGKYIIFQKIESKTNGKELVCPHVVFFDKLFNEIPKRVHLERFRILPFDPPERFMPNGRNSDFPMLNMSAVLDLYKKKNSPEKYITYIGSYPIVHSFTNSADSRAEFGWDEIEDTILYYHSEWKNYSYNLFASEAYVSLRSV